MIELHRNRKNIYFATRDFVFVESEPAPAAPERRCRICQAVLARDNEGSECSSHCDPFVTDPLAGALLTSLLNAHPDGLDLSYLQRDDKRRAVQDAVARLRRFGAQIEKVKPFGFRLVISLEDEEELADLRDAVAEVLP
jgi:hypothetical protein